MAIVETDMSQYLLKAGELLPELEKAYDMQSAFKNSTLTFIETCRHNQNVKYDIRTISEQMGFRQRRFYEVINAFEAIGICPKIDPNTFVWIGFDQIKYTLERIANDRGVFKADVPLGEIFSSKGCISVQRVTEEFLLLFISLEMRRVNILEAAIYLSRENDHEKTTRCKLYQVAAILEIANVIKKTDKSSEFEIMPEYFISASEKMSNKYPDPSSIFSLLNRPEPFCMDTLPPTIRKRIHDYYSTNF